MPPIRPSRVLVKLEVACAVDGSGRAVGTALAGPALESIKTGKAYYGEVPILETPYITGYEPMTRWLRRPDWHLLCRV
jgi:hypothetical protein